MRCLSTALFITLLQMLWISSSAALDEFSTSTAASDPFAAASGSSSNSSGGLMGHDEFLPVEEAYIVHADLSESNGQAQLRLNWQIAEGYYLYRHAFSFALSTQGEPLEITPNIPDGKEKQDEYFGLVQVYYHGLDVDIANLPQRSPLTLAVTSQGCADAGLCYPPRTQYFQLDTASMSAVETAKPIVTAIGPGSAGSQTTTQPAKPPISLFSMLLLAMLGGAILNLMPCVFPVLSLKVLGFANDKGHSPVVHGLTYSVGVIASFVVAAAVLVSLKAAGSAVGWGFHLQSPWFVAALCYLFFIMGLSLSGYIELGASWMNVGGKLAAQSGYGGSFFTGVLATVVASPCTAPFMGTALGFAVTQPTPIALLVFSALGAGMALPVLILSCSPGLLKHIPKPGPWMDTLKQVLAFPLYLTAIWLCWVVGNQTGVNGMAALLVGCVLIVMALWLWRGKTVQRSLAAICTAAALALLGSSLLQPANNQSRDAANSEWLAYSPELLAELRAAGKPVFVNITADWCITCLTNEKVTLSTAAVKQSLQEQGFVYLKGDWTNYDARITALLEQYDRTGIPLYLVYPPDVQSPATVLPQILTVDTVINALHEAVNTETRQALSMNSAP